MRKILVILTSMLALMPMWVLGQQGVTINGVVYDDVGNPLPGANVFIQDTRYGAATDVEGAFSFTLPPEMARGQEVELIAQFIGYRSRSARITLSPGTITQNFELAVDVLELGAVVVTGLGETIKGKLGVSISKVKAQEVIEADESNVVQALAGKAPSVEVVKTSGDPGTSSYIRIRGGASIDRATQPLFVVDGVPITNSLDIMNYGGFSGTYAGSGAETSNRAGDLNNEDIESIEILKGSAASAVYGSRASNGVVLITTKTGRPGKVKINYKFQYGTSEMTRSYPLQNWYGQGTKGAYKKDYIYTWGDSLNVPGAPWYDPSQPETEVFDHSREISDGGYIVDNNLTVSGGNQRTTYFLSAGQYYEKGHWVAGSDYRRTNVRLKATQLIGKKLKLTGNIAYSNVAANAIQRADNMSGIGIAALRTPPEFNNWPYIDPNTGLHRSYRYSTPTVLKKSRKYDNPFFIMYEHKNPSDVDRVFGYIKAEYDLTDWVNLSYHLGSDHSTDDRLNLLPPSAGREGGKGRVLRSTFMHHEIDANLLVTIRGYKLLNRWDFLDGTLMLGHNLNRREYKRLFVGGVDMGTPSGFDQLDNTVDQTPDEGQSQINTESFFGQLTLDLFDQLYVTGAIRNDGSSTFGHSKKRHWYPKTSAA
ncbi:MAG: TonB-dependent receptor plug domain-containing protein, partial [bacterium]